MTTELRRFTDAYATMTIAVYEPVIVRWYSKTGMTVLADNVVKSSGHAATVAAPATRSRRRHRGGAPDGAAHGAVGGALRNVEARALERVMPGGAEAYVNASTPGVELDVFGAHPNLELTPTEAFHGGRMDLLEGDGAQRVPAIPVVFGSRTAMGGMNLDTRKLRIDMTDALTEEIKDYLKHGDKPIPGDELMKLVLDKAKDIVGVQIREPLMPPEGEWLEILSPIGIAHFYRQLYFYVSEGVGPIEQAFTIAPAETLEVVTETVRRQSHEETYEMGSETVAEQAVESRNVDEVSDKVATMVERDTSAAMSANTSFQASGGVGVWNVGASASIGANTAMAQSSQQANEIARRRLKEITKRAAERITKTYSLRVTDATDLTTTNLVRRVIKNDTTDPVNYGLRRVFSRVRVKVQDLGPTLVWQLYVSEPGSGLARSRFVHFSEHQPVAPVGDPPSVRPRPEGGVDAGSTSASVVEDRTKAPTDPMRFYVQLTVPVPADREITAVSIERITDLEHLSKEDYAPSPNNGAQRDGKMDTTTQAYSVKIGVIPGDSASVAIDYQYSYQPSKAALAAWQADYDAAQQKFQQQEADAREKALREQFERQRAIITEKTRIRPRPAADLRREERYEVMNRMVSHLFRPSPSGASGAPSPLEIELFHRYLDVDASFIYTHPSWWVPRYSSGPSGFGRPEYEITAESEPARLGRSLGWVIQLDADDRRNEFLNSPWVRVCIPIRPGREREAVEWLARHIEGDVGYDPKKDPLKSLLASIETARQNQKQVASAGPDYVDVNTVIVSGSDGAPDGPLEPEDVYPVIDQFEVTVPTEGFVYDELTVTIP